MSTGGKLKIAFLGDIFINGSHDNGSIDGAVLVPRLSEDENFFQIGNFEGVAAPEGALPRKFKWATLKMPISHVKNKLQLDIAVLGNNHIGDYYASPALDTARQLGEMGISTCGVGRNVAEACAPAWIIHGDFRIAFISLCCLSTNSEFLAGPNHPGVAPLSIETLSLGIHQAKASGATHIVLLPHWGLERSQEIIEEQVTFAKRCIEMGVDAIIGCHGHVVQPFCQIDYKPVFFGLGNFYFDKVVAENWSGGVKVGEMSIDHSHAERVSLVPTLEFSGRGTVSVSQIQLYEFEYGRAPFEITPSEAFINFDELNKALNDWLRWPYSDRKMAEITYHACIRNYQPSFFYKSPAIPTLTRAYKLRHQVRKFLGKTLRRLKARPH